MREKQVRVALVTGAISGSPSPLIGAGEKGLRILGWTPLPCQLINRQLSAFALRAAGCGAWRSCLFGVGWRVFGGIEAVSLNVSDRKSIARVFVCVTPWPGSRGSI